MSDKCESCMFYTYDEIYDDYVCDMDLDEAAGNDDLQARRVRLWIFLTFWAR